MGPPTRKRRTRAVPADAWPRVASAVIGAHGNRTMGDKSPKAMRKQAGQKQTKTNEDDRKKQAAVAAKQVAAKKK